MSGLKVSEYSYCTVHLNISSLTVIFCTKSSGLTTTVFEIALEDSDSPLNSSYTGYKSTVQGSDNKAN